MMDQFKDYAHSYDAIYEDKNYEAECDFIENIFSKYGDSNIKNVLDLGCGTGGHILPLIRRGYKVTGVDQSEKMLSYARDKSAKAGLNISLVKTDIRTLELNQKFDTVLSMFAVMSYQKTNADATWLSRGDIIPFYCQTKERIDDVPGIYRVLTYCTNCGKDWFVV